MKQSFFKIFALSLVFYMSVITCPAQSGQILLQDENNEAQQLYKGSYALVIGVVEYNNGWPPLRGVKEDVESVKEALEAHGFKVETIMDPDHDALDQAYRDFISKYGMDYENRLILYFAGHGHTVHTSYNEDMGYIVPADAANPNLDRNAFLSKAMAMHQIEVYSKQIQAKHALFVFDACFSGSIFALSRAVPENISYKTAKPVRQFISSGSADETVPDESIFRKQFVSALNDEGDVNGDGYVTGSELGEYLQASVVNYSRGSQHPQYGKIRNPNLDKGDFVFYVGKKDDGKTLAAADTPAPGVESGAVSRNSPDRVDSQIEVEEVYSLLEDLKDERSVFSRIAIRTKEGQYLRAPGGGGKDIQADRENIGPHEAFEIVFLPGDNVALKSYKGNFLSIKDNNRLSASADDITDKELFEFIELDTEKSAFKAYNGNFLCAVDGGENEVVANRDKIMSWEVFSIVKLRKFGLKSHNGLYLRAINGGGEKVLADRKHLQSSETFEFVKLPNDKAAIKTHSGHYLSVDAMGSYARSFKVSKKEEFIIEDLGNNKIALRAYNGKYVTAVGGGGFALKASSTDISDWQVFELVLSGQ